MYKKDDFVTAFGVVSNVDGPGKVSIVPPGSVRSPLAYGARHKTISGIGGLLRKKGASQEEIARVLTLISENAFDVPEDKSEIDYQAHDIATRYCPSVDEYIWSEAGLCDVFVERCGKDFRYCADLGGWFFWDGKRWCRDKMERGRQCVKETIRDLIYQVESELPSDENKKHLKFLTRSETAAKCRAILELSQPVLALCMDDFDRDPLLINLNNGTLDLDTGVLKPHDRADYITRLSPVNYDPDAECETFHAFLDQIFDVDQETISYVQRILGYSLSGSISEQCWFLLYGTGANGKSTLTSLFQYILDDYARQTPAETFLKRNGEIIRNDLARLHGARVVLTSEPPSSGRLDESLLKSFTGGDRVAARYLHKEFFEYVPVGKIFMASNHLLKVQDNDHGFWRRVRLIPFKITIPDEKQDKELLTKLMAEDSGILNWMAQGYKDWKKMGFGEPESARLALDDYRAEMDILEEFLASPFLEFGGDKSVSQTDLYDHYFSFHTGDSHAGALNKNQFNRGLRARGYKTRRVGKHKVYHWAGIALRNDALKGASK